MQTASADTHIASKATACIASGELREVASTAKAALERHKQAAILFSTANQRPDRDRFSRLHRRRPGTILPEAAGARAIGRNVVLPAARGSRPAQLGVVARRNHAVAAALGLAGAAIEWGFGRVAQADRRGEAQPARTGIASVRRRKPPIVSCPQWPATRQHYENAIRAFFAGDTTRFENIDRRMARGCARPRGKACGTGIYRETPARAG